MQITLMPNQPLIFPAKLTSLILQMDDAHTDASIIRVLATLAALPSLSRLGLQLSASEEKNSVKLSLLGACRSLTDLTVQTFYGGRPTHTCNQLDQIRSSLGHLHRFGVGGLTADELARLLHPPVTACWQDIGHVDAWVERPQAADRIGDLVLTLPTLTKVHISYPGDPPNVHFLAQLPQLTALNLNMYGSSIPADELVASLDVSLTCRFQSADWSALFAQLPLKKLKSGRGENLESLRCFAESPITESLEELTIEYLAAPASELVHLSALRRLRKLQLDFCQATRLDDVTLDSFFPPTPRIPTLTSMSHHGVRLRERQGPSFESMQQRQTQ